MTNAEALKEISKKAYEHLSEDDRISWRAEVQEVSVKNKGQVSLIKKKHVLSIILKKIAARARRIGLNRKERLKEQKLRKAVMNSRREIRVHGTSKEQKLGLTAIPLGTIEWMLVYATRGQNEGINGIMKKRDSIIGDGQRTSWLHGQDVLKFRSKVIIVGIKIVALVKREITSTVKNCMRRVHNWRKQRVFLIFLAFMIIRR